MWENGDTPTHIGSRPTWEDDKTLTPTGFIQLKITHMMR